MLNLSQINKGQPLFSVMPMTRNTGKSFMLNTHFLREFMNTPQYKVKRKMELSRTNFGYPQYDSLSEYQSMGRALRYAFT